jgi:DNA-binding MarR family transcriptional regulator
MTNDAPLRLETFLPYRLSLLSNRVSNAIARAYSERFGITIPQWRIIAVLGERGAATATELVAATEMDKVTVSRAVAALVERRLAARASHADDRRARLISLTHAGESVHREVAPIARAHERGLLDALSDAEADALDRLLTKLTEASRRLEDLAVDT